MSDRLPEFAIAFDVPTLRDAIALHDTLGDGPEFAKVGLELFAAEGPAAVRELRARGRRVFLDLKLHDIPNTVRGAARSVAALGADLLTVHATGGAAMVRAAVEGIAEAAGATRVIAVTLLTSLDPDDMPPGFAEPFDLVDAAARLTDLAEAAGALGIVCSAADVAAVRARLGRPFHAVTPGIRPEGGAAHDQKRVASITSAVRTGAGMLVLGRPITAAADPRAALLAAREERSRALAVLAPPDHHPGGCP